MIGVLAQQPLKFLHLRRQRGYLHGQRVRPGPLGRRQLRCRQLITIRCGLPQPRTPRLQFRDPGTQPSGRVRRGRRRRIGHKPQSIKGLPGDP